MDQSRECESDTIIEKMMRREQLRREGVLRKRAEVQINKAQPEKIEHFRATLTEKCTKIEESLNLLSRDDDVVELCSRFDEISKELAILQRFVSGAATIFLISYEVTRADKQVREVEQKYHQLKDELLPKKKFAFKSRKVGVKKQERDVTDTPQYSKSPPLIESMLNRYVDVSYGFANKKGENLILTHEEVFCKDISLTNLEDCTVQLTGSASSLAITSLKNCKIFCGPVTSSIFVEDCTDCNFQVSCQQLRVHKTRTCDFYLHVTSRAIIEDTTQVRFAPYNWHYAEMDAHFELAGFDLNTNNWNAVDDFNWLASDKHSPNWHVLNEDERVTDWKLNGNAN